MDITPLFSSVKRRTPVSLTETPRNEGERNNREGSGEAFKGIDAFMQHERAV